MMKMMSAKHLPVKGGFISELTVIVTCCFQTTSSTTDHLARPIARLLTIGSADAGGSRMLQLEGRCSEMLCE